MVPVTDPRPVEGVPGIAIRQLNPQSGGCGTDGRAVGEDFAPKPKSPYIENKPNFRP
jgi:hypothetical protein